MPEQVQLFRLFVGAPSDVDEAHVVIRGQIEQWNRDHGPLSGARVEFTNWRTHSHPAAGSRPQALLNKQVVDQCDVMVGIFNARFGSPTGVADSGTEEEIRRSIKHGKKVMVYFNTQARFAPPCKQGRFDDPQRAHAVLSTTESPAKRRRRMQNAAAHRASWISVADQKRGFEAAVWYQCMYRDS